MVDREGEDSGSLGQGGHRAPLMACTCYSMNDRDHPDYGV